MQILKTQEFVDDVNSVRDMRLGVIITSRIERLANGNFGDVKSIGDGVSEMRIHYGAGYRVYYTTRGREIIILLCGGPKSDQKRDIKKAKEMAKGV